MQSHCFVEGFADSAELDWLRALQGQFVSSFISESCVMQVLAHRQALSKACWISEIVSAGSSKIASFNGGGLASVFSASPSCTSSQGFILHCCCALVASGGLLVVGTVWWVSVADSAVLSLMELLLG